MINAIAIDDEPLSLALIKEYANQLSDLELVMEFTNGDKALQFLERNDVDLVFLDINMPEYSGLELANQIPTNTKIIFTTAYKEFAFEGFKKGAIDYLLKPFSFNEFCLSITKASVFIKAAHLNNSNQQTHLFVRSEHKLVRVVFQDILFVENIKDYVRFYLTNGRKIMSLMSLQSLESRLPEDFFLKVHRSFIVNTNKVKVIDKKGLVIQDYEIPISEANRKKVSAFFNGLKL